MGMFRFFGNLVFSLIILTALGQIPLKGKPLEHRYHRFVNSKNFQNFFWALAKPVTWSGEKIQSLFDDQDKASSSAR